MGDKPAINNSIDFENPEFNKVLALLHSTNRSIFLTGKAGTGKSTFLRYITENSGKKLVVLAPTGIAAVNVGGQTLHSFFHLPFKPLMPDDPDFSNPHRLFSVLKLGRERLKLIKNLELIIIDEISMVRADMIDFIDRILRFATGNRRQPFGGKQLLLVGDIFQLEPVVTPDMKEILRRWYHAPYFFNAKVFEEMDLVSVELVKVYRQTDREFVEMLDRIRDGNPTKADLMAINSRLLSGNDDDEDKEAFTMTIATRRDMVDHINETRLAALNTPTRTYIGSVTGDFPESSYPTDLELTLKEGAQVVFVKNDAAPFHRWVNGTLGRVIEATDDEIRVELETGSVYTVEPERWDNIRFKYDSATKRVIEEVIGSFTQYPLKLAWALTIHKSQGLTFKHINVDVGRGAFTGGQSYVALSRCTSLEGIRMKSTLNERDIFVNPEIRQFSRKYNDNVAFEEAIRSAQADLLYRDAANAFKEENYGLAVRYLCQASAFRNDLAKPAIARLLAIKIRKFTDDADLRYHNLLADYLIQDTQLREIADEYFEKAEMLRIKKWDPEKAVKQYDKALAVYPRHMEAMLGKAQALLSMSDADGAISLMEKAAQMDEHDYRPPYELGRFFHSCEDYANALDRMLVAVDRNPNIPEIHDSLAAIYEEIEDDGNATHHRKTAAKLRAKKKE
ncbi:MAG: AAA family ATPase [Muribaculaceae bacterium]|nr:AAA family ATPase [Muribaculaceae bacterium]